MAKDILGSRFYDMKTVLPYDFQRFLRVLPIGCIRHLLRLGTSIMGPNIPSCREHRLSEYIKLTLSSTYYPQLDHRALSKFLGTVRSHPTWLGIYGHQRYIIFLDSRLSNFSQRMLFCSFIPSPVANLAGKLVWLF